ncbi:MAG: PSD1 and planctomycete cytochrome C domain-containing protein [Candidatus Hydrogenedentes bacterium]|nr:PSD1 and planctomycete cytochrome C domain-containing protein [Candidatus Hydrogenedentota bacterium]
MGSMTHAMPTWIRSFGVLALASLACIAEPIDFGRDVRPILANSCFKCHGPDEAARQAKLRLDTFEGATALRESGGSAVVPGNPASSMLLARVQSHDIDERMPPAEVGKPLDAAAIGTLKQWIADGATYKPHWAFVKPERPEFPEVLDAAWPRNGIDYFVLARLEREGLKPSPEANRATLARRLYLDLTGLPPTPAEVAAFVNDTSAAAYEKLVDRLLQSPHYGERFARVWLDLARYADTKGYEKDDRRTIWRYRDWVIDAFNADMPFDQFTIMQIAGDLLPGAATNELLATAFHRNTMTNDEGGTDDEEFRSAAVIDRVNTTMSVWMGLTVGCAQCHTHKYDPITHREYYQFYAFFNQTQDADVPADTPVLSTPTQAQSAAIEALDQTIAGEAQRLNYALNRLCEDRPNWEQDLLAAATDLPVLGAWKAGPFLPAGTYEEAFERASAPAAKPDTTDWTVRAEFTDGTVHTLQEGDIGSTSLKRNIQSPDTRQVEFLLGSNDGFILWLNGKEIVSVKTTRSAAADQDRVTATLNEGTNTLLLKVLNAGAGHAFYFKMNAQTFPPEVRAALARDPAARTPEETELIRQQFAAIAPELAPMRERLAALRSERGAIEAAIPNTPILRELATDQQRITRIFERGSFLSPGEPVVPGVPAVFASLPADTPINRLGLAQWLVSPENPLTARVAVNRHWNQFFGSGIVQTLDDFGTQGDWPTHPQLLDWLACEFVANGWSMKELCRVIVTSATYRQASEVSPAVLERDPYNQLYARGPRFRLAAETIRDQALAIGGLLDKTLHGPSVMPPQPEGVWMLVYSADKWTTSEGADRHRRGLYTFWRRSSPYPSMVTFDAPSREVCIAQRTRTNTPLQAFVTLNDPVYVEAAQALARRIMQEAESPADRAKFGFVAAAGREPSSDELAQIVALYESESAHFSADPVAAIEMASNPLGPLPAQLNTADAAAWTVVGNVLLNLDEVLNKT